MEKKELREQLTRKPNIVSLNMFLLEFDITREKFVDMDSEAIDCVKYSIEGNILSNDRKNVKELLERLDVDFNQLGSSSIKKLEVEFVDLRTDAPNPDKKV